MKTIKQGWNKVFFLLALCCFVVLVLAIFSGSQHTWAYFFNSDALYLPTLYHSLFVEGYSLDLWFLNPSILLIPDVVVFFIIRFLSGDVVWSMFLFGIVQNLMIFFGLALIFKEIFKKEFWVLAAFSISIVLLFFLDALLAKNFYFANFALNSTLHFGAFAMAILTLGLSLHYFDKPKSSTLILIFTLSILSVLSDRLFILMYSMPVAAVSLYIAIAYRKRTAIILLISAIISLMLGMWLHGVIDRTWLNVLHLPKITNFDKIGESFFILMNLLKSHLLRWNIFSFIIIAALVSYILQAIIAAKLILKNQCNSPKAFYLLFSLIFIPVVFLMPVLTGTFTQLSIMRYNISAFFMAIINLGFLLAYLIEIKNYKAWILISSKMLFIALLITMFGIGFSKISSEGLDRFFNYYPDYVRELDEIAEEENLQYGLASFWYAKPITVFSRKGLKVYHVFDELIPYVHVTSLEYYTREDHVFNFVVMNTINNKEAWRKYLDSEVEIKMVNKGKTEVMILPPFKFRRIQGYGARPYFVDPQNRATSDSLGSGFQPDR